jgi:hypothetical protein
VNTSPEILDQLRTQTGREVSLSLFNRDLEFRQYRGTQVEFNPSVIALENDQGDDLIAVNQVTIVGVNSPFGLDLTSESERLRHSTGIKRVIQGLDISEDSD